MICTLNPDKKEISREPAPFAFLEYEVFSKSALICLAIQKFTFYAFVNRDGVE